MTVIQPSVITYGKDANGWIGIDEGYFKRFYKVLGPYTTGSIAANGTTVLATSENMPVGVTAAEIVGLTSQGVNDNTNSNQFYTAVYFDVGSTNTVFDVGLRNLTTSALTYSAVYVYVCLTVRDV